jgi:lysophospholipase L1-like esterase
VRAAGDPGDAVEERPEQPEPFLRGCAWPAGGGVPYPRCDPGPAGLRLPADTRACAALPVGVRLELLGEPAAIEIDYETRTAELGHRGTGAGTRFALFRGTKRISDAAAVLGAGTARLAAGSGPERAIVYLPEGMRPLVHRVRGVGGGISPAPRLPRWICYGDSIAEGWCASEPAAAWPHLAARERGLDVVNLGYAGAARGEIASAEEIASLPAELVSIAHGTNCWTRTPHSAAMLAEGLRAFLAIVREGHPRTPIVAVSPILRADAESEPNRLGATLAGLRAVFEAVVRERIAWGDRALHLVSGLPLVARERMPDGIHPDDEGHAQLARALGPVLAQVLGRRPAEGAPDA